jgi:DNA-binding Lrp family transcriptional regulator
MKKSITDQKNEIRAKRKEKEELGLLFTLISNSRQSDREIAKTLHLSQTTITKRRKELERERFIQQYTVTPDFLKMGYEIVAFIFHPGVTMPSPPPTPERIRRTREWYNAQPQIVYAAFGEGFAVSLMITVHRNYSDFVTFMTKMRDLIADRPQRGDFLYFVVDTKNNLNKVKAFSLKDLSNMETEQQLDYHLEKKRIRELFGKD